MKKLNLKKKTIAFLNGIEALENGERVLGGKTGLMNTECGTPTVVTSPCETQAQDDNCRTRHPQATCNP